MTHFARLQIALSCLFLTLGVFSQDLVYKDMDGEWRSADTLRSIPGPPQAQVRGASVTFNVTYEDVTNNNNIGFDDPTLGATRRATLESVFAYIASVLADTGTADVEIRASQTDGGGSLASAGTYYPVSNGFKTGIAFTHITTGVDPSGSVNDIHVRVDFGYTWNSDTGPVASGEFDLFSVLLHEVTHGLGIAGLIESDGTSGVTGSNPGAFSVFEQMLETGNGDALFDGSATYVRPTNALTGAEGGVVFTGANAAAEFGSDVPIYAPGTFNSGSSIGHWDTTVGTAVMRHSIGSNTERRTYQDWEIEVLRDLGYTIFACSNPGVVLDATLAVCPGDSPTLTPLISGDGPFTYQWKKDGVDLGGETSSTLSLTIVSDADEADYTVDVTNACGTTSATLTLTVDQTAVITTSPASIEPCAGSSPTLTVVATGENLTYQWVKDDVDISGETSASLTLINIAADDAGNYICRVTNGCNTVSTTRATVTVIVVPTVSIATAQTVCGGSNITLTPIIGGDGPLSYQWKKDGVIMGGETSATLSLNGVSNADEAVYTIEVTNTCGTVSDAQTLTITELAAITTPPASTQVCPGASPTLTVAASGENLSYQWQKDNVDIGGTTSSSLTLTSIEAADAGSYTCVVSNGCNSVESAAAVVTVLDPPTVDLTAAQTVCEGADVTLTPVIGGSAPLTYQWKKDGVDLPGETAATLSLTGVDDADEATYTIEVTNSCGTVSDTQTLTVTDLVAITTPPASIQPCAGDSPTLTVVASGENLAYQWKKDGVDVSGETNASITLTDIASGNAGDYTCVVSNGCNSVESAAATVTVLEPATVAIDATDSVCEGGNITLTPVIGGSAPLTYQWKKDGVIMGGQTSATLTISNATSSDAASYTIEVTNSCGTVSDATILTISDLATITTQPTSIEPCEGTSPTLTVIATGGGLTYQWKKDNVDVPGATSSTLTLTNITASDAGDYTCVVTNPCNSVTSSAATVTVLDPLSVDLGNAQTLCAGAGVTLTPVVVGSGPFTYQWKKDGGILAGQTSATLNLTNLSNADEGTYLVEVTSSCGTVSDSMSLTVTELVAITTQPESVEPCVGGNTSLTVVASGENLTYQWKKNNVDLGGETSATLSFTNVDPDDAGSYTCVISNACNSVTSAAADVTVLDPATVDLSASQTVCGGEEVVLTPVIGGSEPLSYQWKKDGLDLAGETSATLTLSGVSNADEGTYTIEVTNACGTVSDAHVLTVTELVAITSQPESIQPCFGDDVTLTIGAEGEGLTYQWKKDGVDLPGEVSTSLDLTNFQAVDEGDYICVVTNSCNSVTSDSATLSGVNGASVDMAATQTVCGGSAVVLEPVIGGSGLTYQWKKNNTDLPGETGPTLTLTNVSNADEGIYTLNVDSSCGSASDSITLTVTDPVVITTQPVGATICEGLTKVLSVAATGENLTYQWRKDGADIIGATEATYTIIGAAAEDAGVFTCVVGNGCGSITSTTARIDIGFTVEVQPRVTALGVGVATLKAVPSCDLDTGFLWFVLGEDIPLGSGDTVLVAPDATTTYLVRAFIANDETEATAIVLVNPNDFNQDPNNDGENTIEDVWAVVEFWLTDLFPEWDVNDDGVINIIDLLYINTGL